MAQSILTAQRKCLLFLTENGEALKKQLVRQLFADWLDCSCARSCAQAVMQLGPGSLQLG